MNCDSQVFISHAGEDKSTVAVPLYHALAQRSISSFVDVVGLKCGDNAPEEMLRLMENAPVGVFILSPHFLAKKWPMDELYCFLERAETAAKQNIKLPVLVPVFYSLSVALCTSKEVFKARDSDGDNIFEKFGFNDRWERGETSRQEVLDAMLKLSKFTGVENEERATNLQTDDMRQARFLLVQRLANQLQDVVVRHFTPSASHSTPRVLPCHSYSRPDFFSPKYLVPLPSPNDVLDFTTRNSGGEFCTAEGKFKARLLSQLTNLRGSATGNASFHVPSAIGMGGVGKSTAMIGIAWEPDVRKIFCDGIYLISAGENADEDYILREVANVVEACGGFQLAARIREAPDLQSGVLRASSWFDQKKILLLLDDLWEAELSPLGFLNELRRLVSPPGRILITTRSKDIAQEAGCPVPFYALDPRSDESHRLLLRYADLEEDKFRYGATNGNSYLENVLDRCAGLRLALAIAGCAIRELMEDDGVFGHNVMQIYHSVLERGGDIDMLDRFGNHRGLRNMVQASLVTADRWFQNESLCNSSGDILPPRELYEQLSVLRKQIRVSAIVLSKLWGTANSIQATEIANKFCKLSLLSRDRDRYVVHDLLMDVCIVKAANTRRLTSYHRTLLRRFSCPVIDATKRAWWDMDVDCDGYLWENLARHLRGGECLDELRRLLTDTRWTLYRATGSSYLPLQNDFSELQTGIIRAARGRVDNFKRELQRRNCGMYLVERAVSLGWARLRANPAELAFQMFGRLKRYLNDFSEVRDFLASATQNAERPWLRPEQQCLAGPENKHLLTMRMEGPVDALVVDHLCHRAYVGVGDDIVAVDVASRQVVETAHMGGIFVRSLGGSGDGRLIVSLSSDLRVRMWEVERLQVVGSLERCDGVTCVAISRSGKRIVSGTRHGVLHVWDAGSASHAGKRLRGHPSSVSCVALSGDGKRAVSGSRDGTLRVWDIEHMNQNSTILTGHNANVECVYMSEDGRKIASGSEDRTIRLWDAENMDQVGDALKGHTDVVRCLTMSHDGNIIVSGSWDRTVRVWDAVRMRELGGPLRGHTDSVTCVYISHDGERIVSGSQDGTLYVWDAERIFQERGFFKGIRTNRVIETLAELGDSNQCCEERRVPYRRDECLCVGMSKDETITVLGGSDGTLRIWDAGRIGRVGEPVQGHSDEVTCVSISDDGEFFVSGSLDGTLCVWDRQRMCRVGRPLKGHDGRVSCVAISQDGKRFVSASWDGTLCIWDAERMCRVGEPLRDHGTDLSCVVASENGRWIVAGSWNGMVSVWDLEGMSPSCQTVIIWNVPLKMHFVDTNLVLCITDGGSVLVRIDSHVGPVRVESAEFSHGDASSTEDASRSVLHCRENQIWMEFPGRKLLGTLEEKIVAWAFHEASNMILVCHESGVLFRFRLIL